MRIELGSGGDDEDDPCFVRRGGRKMSFAAELMRIGIWGDDEDDPPMGEQGGGGAAMRR